MFTSNAMTVASHATMILGLLLLMTRLLRVVNSQFQNVIDISCFAAAALIIERTYYIAARLLVPHGIDLWKAHPAPQVLSLVVAFALICTGVALRNPLANFKSLLNKRTLAEFSILAAIWLTIALWLG